MDPFEMVIEQIEGMGGVPVRIRLEKNWGTPPSASPSLEGWVLWRKTTAEPLFEDRPFVVHHIGYTDGGPELLDGLYDVPWDDAFDCYTSGSLRVSH